ncbi:cysteine desulfurase family protein [Jeotgalibacillus proteolyticus]|uniref:Cysteine desulfurase NifS n=1 Tax=Jeotgalibacillus proteolyticus TaxID=2082395 RepID=A0A2S5GF43_9BACL|nr:cysteine desulfurase family protein [Jeotgalibacillus proteolyticus]PPA71650.1 cysteine desulfurase NifS [Jeotgalibacillus proteolyticus]
MIYLDNSATTKPYKEVLSSFITINEKHFGNPSSLHEMGTTASLLLEKAREQAALILGVKSDEMIFTSGGTESNNSAIKGIAEANRYKGRHIITTDIEHPSVYNTVKELETKGFRVSFLKVNQEGIISLEELKRLLTSETILVSIMHVNNEVGSIQPIQEAGKIIKEKSKAVFHVDAIQSFGKVPILIENSSIDSLSLSAHKFHGMKGNGLLYMKKNLLFTPQLSGGSQERGIRSGTENVGGAVSTAKAMRMTMENMHSQNLNQHRSRLVHFFASRPEVKLVSPQQEGAPHIVNVTVPGLKGEVIVHALEQEGIFISTTSACSSKKAQISKTILAMGFSEKDARGSVRISMSHLTEPAEIDRLLEAWRKVIPPLLKGIKRNEV